MTPVDLVGVMAMSTDLSEQQMEIDRRHERNLKYRPNLEEQKRRIDAAQQRRARKNAKRLAEKARQG